MRHRAPRSGHLTIVMLLTLAVPATAQAASARSDVPHDPLRDRQWALDRMAFPEAWKSSRGAGVVVAVLDTGVDLGHPDLQGKLIVHPDADLVDPAGCRENGCVQDGPMDPHGHGTAMAGIIASRTGNQVGIAGAAPDALILPVRVRAADGTIAGDAVARGIVYAVDHGADVISMSLAEGAFPYEVENLWRENDPLCIAGGVCRNLDAMFDAIEYAWDRGAMLVGAAGNGIYVEGAAVPSCAEPAGHPRVLCVGATDYFDRHAYYSHFDAFNGNLVVGPSGGDVSASPLGEDLSPCSQRIVAPVPSEMVRPCPGDLPVGYTYVSGTSSPTALTAGLAALLMSRGMTNAETLSTIMETARDLGPPGRDALFGYGQVDAARAMSLLG